MHRIDDPTAAPTLPAPRPAGTPGYFTGGSPGSRLRRDHRPLRVYECVAGGDIACHRASGTDTQQDQQRTIADKRYKACFARHLAPTQRFMSIQRVMTPTTACTPGSAFRTPQAAINTIQTRYNLAGFSVTIQLAAGTYQGPIQIGGTFVGAVNQATVTLLGNVASPGTVIINAPSSGYGLSLIQYGSIVISGVTFTAGSGNRIAVGQNCLISFGLGLALARARPGRISIFGTAAWDSDARAIQFPGQRARISHST